MNSFNKVLSTMVVVTTISSCTSLSDFEGMTAEQRATKVCNKRYKDEANQLSQYKQKITDQRSVLSAGYRLMEQCETKYVTTGTSCREYFGTLKCSDDIEEKKICRNIPIQIDYEYEQKRLTSIESAYSEYRQKLKTAYQGCYTSIVPLSASQAFSHYKY